MKNRSLYLLVLLIMLTLSIVAEANVTNFTRTFTEKVGSFNNSKEFRKTVTMPLNLLNQGYVFTTRSVVTRGDAKIINESLTGDTYSFTMKISKSFFESAKGEVIVTMYAEKGGSTGYVGPVNPGNPTPVTPPSYPGGGYGNVDANTPPTPSYPNNSSSVNISNGNENVRFSWSDPLRGKEFRIRIYTENGSKVADSKVNGMNFSIKGNKFVSGTYRWQVARNNRAGFLTDIPLIGGAFADWSNFSSPVMFRVQRTDYVYNNPSYPWSPSPTPVNPNPTYPSDPGNQSPIVERPNPTAPSMDSRFPQSGSITFNWSGSGNEFEIMVYDRISSPVFTRRLSSNSVSVPATTFQPGITYKWQVKARSGNTWSAFSQAYRFTVIPARQQFKEALEAQYDYRDSDLALQRLSTLEQDTEIGSQAKLLKAETLMDSGSYSEAVSILQSLLNDEKVRKPVVLSNLINCYIEMGNLGMAVMYSKTLVEEFPESSQAAEVRHLVK
ncbi:MAG: tetratricopeptide repeat protein [Candidatus Muiribacteriota bacterium]